MSLLTAIQRKIFAHIMSLVANVNDADDILRETVQTMLKQFGEFELGTDFLAWGVTIAYYRVFDFRKQKSKAKLVFNDEIFRNLEQGEWTQLTFTLSTGSSPSGVGDAMRLGFENTGTRNTYHWYAQVVIDSVTFTELE